MLYESLTFIPRAVKGTTEFRNYLEKSKHPGHTITEERINDIEGASDDNSSSVGIQPAESSSSARSPQDNPLLPTEISLDKGHGPIYIGDLSEVKAYMARTESVKDESEPAQLSAPATTDSNATNSPRTARTHQIPPNYREQSIFLQELDLSSPVQSLLQSHIK